ncbi:MAG: hypothetical protein Q8N26_38180 [Myxococcales bacterium]|nr:hypothetical protein [Myxococcales bacterium]
MAWEKRGGRLVYYSARRVGRRVVKQYLGDGPVAQATAALEQASKLEREASREEERERQAAEAELEANGRQLDACINRLLTTIGLHRPKRGRWRRRRAGGVD